jgi:hypothetical protein
LGKLQPLGLAAFIVSTDHGVLNANRRVRNILAAETRVTGGALAGNAGKMEKAVTLVML